MNKVKNKRSHPAVVYFVSYLAVMMLVVTLLFLFFPTLKDIMHMWFPNDWVRYAAIFIIIILLPIIIIASLLSDSGAIGFLLLFNFPTRKYTKRDVAFFYLVFGIVILIVLLLVIFFVYGGSIV